MTRFLRATRSTTLGHSSTGDRLPKRRAVPPGSVSYRHQGVRGGSPRSQAGHASVTVSQPRLAKNPWIVLPCRPPSLLCPSARSRSTFAFGTPLVPQVTASLAGAVTARFGSCAPLCTCRGRGIALPPPRTRLDPRTRCSRSAKPDLVCLVRGDNRAIRQGRRHLVTEALLLSRIRESGLLAGASIFPL